MAASVVGTLCLTAASVPAGAAGAGPSRAAQSEVQAVSGPAGQTPTHPRHRRLPARYTGRIFAIGDSVMLGARKCLPQHGITADPKGNRQPYQGAAILAAMRTRLPHVVIVHLGTNGGISDSDIDTIMRILGPQRLVVWVTLQLRNDYTRYRYEDSSNQALREVVLRYPHVRVADWNAYTETHKGLVGGDGIHLTHSGCVAYAGLVDAVARAA